MDKREENSLDETIKKQREGKETANQQTKTKNQEVKKQDQDNRNLDTNEKDTNNKNKEKDAKKEKETLEQEKAIEEKYEDELKKHIKELTEKILRLQAEFDNYKKRTAKEKEQLTYQAQAQLMLQLLPAYEDLERALKEAEKIENKQIKEGIILSFSNLKKAFESQGLIEMKLEGEKFDPFKHESAMIEESDQPEGTILHVIKKGYLYKGEVLRHAIVTISSGKKQK
jgi:molecular chaperone GrpE